MSSLAAIQKQVEYYFSHENLQKDKYLLNMMDSDGWVDLTALSRFPQLAKLVAESSHDVLNDAIVNSPLLEMDESSVRIRLLPSARERTLILLRDVDSKCSTKDILSLFHDKSFGPTEIRPDVLNNWYLSFDSRSSALEAFDFLQNPSTVLLSKPVNCRVTTQTITIPTHNRPRGSSHRGRGGPRGRGNPRYRESRSRDRGSRDQYPSPKTTVVNPRHARIESGYSDPNAVKKYSFEEVSEVAQKISELPIEANVDNHNDLVKEGVVSEQRIKPVTTVPSGTSSFADVLKKAVGKQ
ncbi:hypothetical protein GEMRC1_011485 [Eukaryota sp. GEM-RC1]